MKNILLTTVLLAGFAGKAQTHRFIYDVEYKKKILQKMLPLKKIIISILSLK